MQPWKRFEHFIVELLRRHGFEAQRTTNSRQAQILCADINAGWRGVEFAIECKQSTRGAKSYRIYKEWFSKLEDAVSGTDRVPVLVFNFYQSRDGQIWCIRGDRFFELLERIYRKGYDIRMHVESDEIGEGVST